MRGYTAVTESLTAQHLDPVLGEGLHWHTWQVTTFYPYRPLRDGRALKAALRLLLDTLTDEETHTLRIWSGEEMAEMIAQLLTGCIGCRVTRAEGYEAMVWLGDPP